MDLRKLFPKIADEKVNYLIKGNWPKMYVENTGRAVVKSIGNCHINIVRMLQSVQKALRDDREPVIDILCMCYEEVSIKRTVVNDIKLSLKYSELPESIFVENLPDHNRKWIGLKIGGKEARIWFAHGSGKKYYNIKGWRPFLENRDKKGRVVPNKWWCLWFYEFDSFDMWTPADVQQCVATLERGGDCHEEFHILIEQNEPIPGGCGSWTLAFYDQKMKEEQVRKDLVEGKIVNSLLDKNDRSLAREIIVYKKYSLMDFGLGDYWKFTSAEQRATINTLYLADRETFDWVYAGKKITGNLAVFKNLRKEEHFGRWANFKPTYLSIGIDYGNLDACCCVLRGVEMGEPQKDIRVQDGMYYCWHSNRWKETLMPREMTQKWTGGEKWGITGSPVENVAFEHKDITTWLYGDALNFIKFCCQKFPYNQIYVYLEYADGNSGFYVQELNGCLRGYQAQVVPNWYKGQISDRILVDKLMIAKKCYKIEGEELWEARTSLQYVDRVEREDKDLKIMDETSRYEQKYFDLNDACWYCWPSDVQESVKGFLLGTESGQK